MLMAAIETLMALWDLSYEYENVVEPHITESKQPDVFDEDALEAIE